MVLTQSRTCERGYESTDTRAPQDGSNKPMNEQAHCAEPPTRATPAGRTPRAGAAYRAPVVASYDPDSGRLRWGDKVDPALASPGRAAPQTGEESWKWLFLQPLTRPQE